MILCIRYVVKQHQMLDTNQPPLAYSQHYFKSLVLPDITFGYYHRSSMSKLPKQPTMSVNKSTIMQPEHTLDSPQGRWQRWSENTLAARLCLCGSTFKVCMIVCICSWPVSKSPAHPHAGSNHSSCTCLSVKNLIGHSLRDILASSPLVK